MIWTGTAIVALALAAENMPGMPDIFSADAVAQQARAAHPVPGLVCALVDRNGVVAVGADGVRVAGGTDAITVRDRMHLGSCLKAMTATLAATFVAEGSLRWDSTVGDVLGATYPAMDPAWKPVTLAELLMHRGGVAGSPPADAWRTAFACTDPPQQCRAAFIATLLAGAPGSPRGGFQYSNQGYAVAGRMMEVVAKQDYEALIAARLFAPLGIRDFGFGPPSRVDPASPKGHDPGGTVADIDNPSAIAPAGTLHMPVGEWAKFIAFHLGATPPKELAGAAKELAALHRPSEDAAKYAMGWLVAQRPWGGTVLNHAGSNSKWFCVAWLAPEKGFAVLAACNEGGDAATKACDAACAALIGERVKAAKAAPAAPANAPASPAAPVAPVAPAAPAAPPAAPAR
ncbi:MAG: serine hydrolase domain-containing protein [Phycisphaerales bacterium]